MKAHGVAGSVERGADADSQSPRRRRELRDATSDDDHRSANSGNSDDAEDAEQSEEKLKVVIRVRPLQKNEKPWSAKKRSGEEEEEDYQVGGGTKGARSTGGPSTSPAPTEPVESALAIHETSVSWEKNGQTKILLADAVFDGSASQADVFHSVEDCIDGLFAGFDCSVFAYGQTGTGKTHTMSGLPHNGRALHLDDEDDDGDSSEIDAALGVVPRCIHKLFDQIEQQRASEGPGVSFALYCSFVEIYNERIYDILSSDAGINSTPSQASNATPRNLRAVDNRAGWNRAQPAKEAASLQIRQKLDGSVFVDGLTSRRISSRTEMLRAFREGSMNREVRDNLYNQHSSRGHSVFQVTLRKNVSAETNNTSPRSSNSTSPKRPPSTSTKPSSAAANSSSKSRLSRLFFVDLAGSEKWHVNGSDLSDKYATELSSINKSLSALTNCVLALTQKERTHVPFRDSVLTRLLQSCLQGQGRTAFIVTISPARDSLEESFATLRFAERLKALRCRPIRRKIFANELVMGEQRVYYEKQIHSMRLEVTRLRDLLKKAQRLNQEITDSTAAAANVALIEENRRLKELLMHSERNRLVERSERLNNPKAVKLSASSSSTVEASPQRQAAKQILASSPRPFSEEEASPKSISGADANDSSGGGSHDAPSTPQPRRSNGRERDQQRHEERRNMGEEEKEYSTLVNRLQDKEAHLNWMLEAEIEAQNTRGHGLPRVANGSHGSGDVQDAGANGKPTVTRSWAVERALRRNLVAVPTPVRGGSTTTASSPAATASPAPANAVTVAVASSKPLTQHPSEPIINPSLVRQRPVFTESHQPPSVKYDSPRQPVRVGDATATHEASTPRSLPVRVPAAPSAAAKASHAPITLEEAPAKSASILKLVGSTTADKMGKSKDELVDEYKRARRAELEAMLRTMVHR